MIGELNKYRALLADCRQLLKNTGDDFLGNGAERQAGNNSPDLATMGNHFLESGSIAFDDFQLRKLVAQMADHCWRLFHQHQITGIYTPGEQGLGDRPHAGSEFNHQSRPVRDHGGHASGEKRRAGQYRANGLGVA